MGNLPTYLPRDIIDSIDIDLCNPALSDSAWKLRRLLEQAYAAGYADAYTRGYFEAHTDIDRKERQRAAQHEDTCPARRSTPKCQCYTPPSEVDRG